MKYYILFTYVKKIITYVIKFQLLGVDAKIDD